MTSDAEPRPTLTSLFRRRRRHLPMLILLAAALTVFFVLAPRWPHDQTVHVVLGDLAPRIEEVHVRYAEATHTTEAPEDWTREVDFRYGLIDTRSGDGEGEGIGDAGGERGEPRGSGAPRIVTHEPRLPNGEYIVEIDLVSSPGRTTLRRRVTLEGGTTSIDVSRAIP